MLDVNGTEFALRTHARGRVEVDLETGEATLRNLVKIENDTLIGFADSGRFKIVVYRMLPNFLDGQLYTAIYRWMGDGVGDNFGFQPYINSLHTGRARRDTANDPLEWTEPLIVTSVVETAPHRWLLDGISGPRWEGDITLFDQVVGGQQFTVRLKEFGFGDWPAQAASDIPEPTWALMATSIPLVLVYGHSLWRSRRT
jgi:hypothetical protein